MTGALHGNLAERWGTLTVSEQMANVGSEVGRTIRAHATNNPARFQASLARALELFDLTATDHRWTGHRTREILRAREEFCRLFFDEDVPADSAAGLDRYFTHFAQAANRMRGRA